MAAFRDCLCIPVVLFLQIESLYVTGEMWSSGHVFFTTLWPHVSEDSRVPERWESVPRREWRWSMVIIASVICESKKKEKNKLTSSHGHSVRFSDSIWLQPGLLPLICLQCCKSQWFKKNLILKLPKEKNAHRKPDSPQPAWIRKQFSKT